MQKPAFTLTQMEEAVEMIACVNNIDEWREAVSAKDGPLHECEIPVEVEQIVINEMFKEHGDDAQRAMEMFSLRQRMN